MLRFICLTIHFALPHTFVRAQGFEPTGSIDASQQSTVNRSPAIIAPAIPYDPNAPADDSAQTTTDASVSPEALAIIEAGKKIRSELVPEEIRKELTGFKRAMHGDSEKKEGGFFAEISKRYTYAEQRSQSELRPSMNDANVREALMRAVNLKENVEVKLFDKNLTPEIRQSILNEFIENVLFPVRELLMLTFRQEDVEKHFANINANRRKKGLHELKVFDPVQIYLPQMPDVVAKPKSAEENFFNAGRDPRLPNGLRIDDLGNREDQNDNCRNQRRLAFDFHPIATLTRDIRALSHGLSKETYMRGLKLMTLQMIIQQIQFHNNNLGVKEELTIPPGCRTEAAGMMPEKVKLDLQKEKDRESAMDALLSSQGLLRGNDEYNNFYLNDINAGGLGGGLPFQQLSASRLGLDPKRARKVTSDPNYDGKNQQQSFRHRDILEPAFDDQLDFKNIFALKVSQAKSLVNPANAETLIPLLEPIHTPVTEKLEIEDGTLKKEKFLNGMPAFLVERMKAAKTVELSHPEVVCPEAKKFLESNRVHLPFPRKVGSDSSQRWALSELWFFLRFYKDPKNQTPLFQQTFHKAICLQEKSEQSSEVQKICAGGVAGVGQIFQHFEKNLGEYVDPTDHLPRTAIEDPFVEKNYLSLFNLWETARKYEGSKGAILPNAQQSEWDFVYSRRDTSPWATQRIAHVVAKYCGVLPEIKKEDSESIRNQKISIHRDFDQVASVLGLQGPMGPEHGNRILKHEEKLTIWQKNIEKVNEGTAFTFNATAEGYTQDTFDRLKNLHQDKAALSQSDVKDLLEKHFPNLRGNVKQQISAGQEKAKIEILKEGETVGQKISTQESEALAKLYQMRNSNLPLEERIASQKKIIEDMAIKFDGLSSSADAKVRFLTLENEYKRPLYHQMIKQASAKRKGELKEKLKELCEMDYTKDLAKFKDMVRATVNSQDELNQILGIQALPKSVKEELDRWSKTDKDNMKLTALQMVFFVSAAALSAGCIAGSGGTCAPVAAAVMSAAATGTQLFVFNNSLKAAHEAKERKRYLQAWADLGFSTNEEVKATGDGASYMMATMDALFTAPLISATAKFGQTSVRAAWASRSSIVRGLEHLGIQQAALTGDEFALKELARLSEDASKVARGSAKIKIQSLAHETEIKSSLYTLGFQSIGDDLAKAGTKLGSALKRELLDAPNLEKISRIEVRKAFGKTVASHFSNSPQKMQNFFGSYTNSRFDSIEKSLASYTSKYLDQNPGFLRGLLAKTGFPASRIEKLSTHIVTLKKMNELSSKLTASQAKGETFEVFVTAHADELQELFMKLPMRKREIPYYILTQGSPFTFSTLPGLKQTLGVVDEALLLRKVAVASETLGFEVARKDAFHALKIPPEIALKPTYYLVEEFMKLSQSVFDSTEKEGAVALSKLATFQSDVAARIAQHQAKNNPTAAVPQGEKLIQLLFHPKDAKEKQMAEILWNSTPPEELFAYRDLGETADVMLRRLANYSDIEEFEKYMAALRVLTATKRPNVITN